MRVIEDFLSPISEAKPAGEFLYYEELYSRIQEAARADDTLPKGVWAFEEKSADWKQVAVLCEEGLSRKTKDLNIAGWLVQAWSQLYGIKGTTEGFRLLEQLCQRYWDNIFPAIEADGDETFRVSSLAWLVKKTSLLLRQMPLFISKVEMKPSLSIYHYIVVSRMMQSGETLPEHEQIQALWSESAHFSTLESLQETRAQLKKLTSCVKALDNFVSEKITQNGVSFSLIYTEIEKGFEAIESIEMIKEEARKQKEAAKQEEQKASVQEEQTLSEAEAEVSPKEEESKVIDEVPASDSLETKKEEGVASGEAVLLQESRESSINTKDEVMTSAQVYERVRHLLQTLHSVDPQNPIADLLLQILNYQSLPFRDLIKKYAPKGALSRIHSILEQDAVK